MIELIEDYVSINFGKPINNEWGIRTDHKRYVLLVDKVPVVEISVEYERFDKSKPNYSCAHISYNNLFYAKDNKEYLNKGYTKLALSMITERLISEGNIPRINLNILPSNEISKHIALSSGYVPMINNDYSIFLPDAIEQYIEGLSYLKDIDEDIYELQLEKYQLFYEKYISYKQESSKRF